MIIPTIDIRIGNYSFNAVNDVEIKRSNREIATSAIIKLPSTAVLRRGDQPPAKVETAQQFVEGDIVEIKMGYSGTNHTEFYGFVSNINQTTPVEIECEDFMYLLRQKQIQKSYENTTLKEALNDIINQVVWADNGLPREMTLSNDIQVIDIDNFLLASDEGEAVSRARALQHIKDTYGIAVYFNLDGELYAGLQYTQQLGTVIYGFGRNIIKEDDLRFVNADTRQIQIKAVNIKPDGTRTEVIVGDETGSSRTIFFWDVATEVQLKKLAQNELEKYKFDGYEGVLEAFLLPRAIPGMLAEIRNEVYPEKEGTYYIDSVQIKYGMNGARRFVEIGQRLTS